MKARYRKTGEIVTIVAYSGQVDRETFDFVYYIDSNGKEHTEDGRGLNLYWDFETEIENPSINKTIVDWSSFRREAAKDILKTLISEAARRTYVPETIVKGLWCTKAVEWADELIKELKRK